MVELAVQDEAVFASQIPLNGFLDDAASLCGGELVRCSMRWGALGMVATTVVYLLAASVLAPDLWADPLGPYVKTVPGAVLALVALALAEER
jgi:hypothetical protein